MSRLDAYEHMNLHRPSCNVECPPKQDDERRTWTDWGRKHEMTDGQKRGTDGKEQETDREGWNNTASK